MQIRIRQSVRKGLCPEGVRIARKMVFMRVRLLGNQSFCDNIHAQYAMNAIPKALPNVKAPQKFGSQISLIILFSVQAGSWLEKASSHYFVPRQPYEWTGDLIFGVGFLIGAIAFALRLRREVTSMRHRTHASFDY